MSRILAQQLEIEHGPAGRLIDGTLPEYPDLDADFDDEMLLFLQALLKKLDELPEGEALVIWKELW